MGAPQKITELIAAFTARRHELTAGKYKEFQLQTDFLNPLFKELGWDIENKIGLSEGARDVIQQVALRVGPTSKAPDYSFGIGRDRKFIVEAKKPSVNVKDDPAPALQARSYGWNADLPLAVLTDFEEFAVYDCRIRPKKNDKPTTARIFFCMFDEYEKRWDEIAAIFSRAAVVRGDFDTFANTKTKHRGSDTVDDALLKDIDEWRRLLATNIAIRNEALSEEQVNYAVQKILDRILFLRICEDRGIEQWETLRKQTDGADIYHNLLQQFRQADARYNSGLFHFSDEAGISESPDTITPGLAIDDKILKQIITQLYPPESPYNFAVLPPEILGQVYEQFLGKVIRLTAGHHAKVEEKPEVRKAGGVYYTPSYIVQYIVDHTVGKLLEGKTPKEVAKLTIVDPACGSGSFLLGAYQKLLDWHLGYYTTHDPTKWKKELYQVPCHPEPVEGDKEKSWRLTTAERKRILLANIYGVDLDAQAVEVTKLSLLLKVLEGEDEETLGQQMSFVKERALPSLSDNIKCGNSLIGSDFSDTVQSSLLPSEASQSINTFDWEHEFPAVFKAGGFDAVIGNPPYIRIQAMKEFAPETVPYLSRKYGSAAKGNYDIYVVFVEKGLQLLNPKGALGYILPHKFFNAQYGESLRKILSDGKHLQHVVHFGDQQVFSGATTYTCLMLISQAANKDCDFVKVTDLDEWRHDHDQSERGKVATKNVSEKEWNFVVGRGAELFEKLKAMPVKLGDIADGIFQGLITGADSVFLLEKREDGYCSSTTGKIHRIETELMHNLCKGSVNIKRYHVIVPEKYILFPYELKDDVAHLISTDTFKKKFPNAWAYLCECRIPLEQRERGKWKNEKWYAFGRTQNLTEMEQRKILTPSISSHASFTLDDKDHYYFVGSGGGGGGGYGIVLKKNVQLEYRYVLGLLNSRLLDVYLHTYASQFSGGFYAYNRQYIEPLPIHNIDFNNATEKSQHDRLVTLVDRMLDLHKRLAAAKTPHEQDQYKRQIASTDREIDTLVFDLYGLTEEERGIVLQS